LLGAALIGVAAVGGWRADDVWRDAYPYLPRRVQSVPYRLRAAFRTGALTPVALPTPRSGAGVAAPARSPRSLDVPTTPAMTEATTGGNAPTTATRRTSALSTPTFPAPTPTAPEPRRPSSVALSGFRHEYQTWNNCGPATLSMVLGYHGIAGDQASAAHELKPDPDDKNVGPEELARYAREQGLAAAVRFNGTPDRLKVLIALGVPVIVETWFVPVPGDEMGHYRVVSGYRDDDQVFVTQDAYDGPDVLVPYAEFDTLWRVFNRVYVVVYPAGRGGDVASVLGADRDDRAMSVAAVARAETELVDAPDAFGWFNLGSSLLGLGDATGAAGAYDRARAIGLPWRMLWYQLGPFEAYAAVARWDDVRALAEANLRNAGNLEESHYWRGRALAASGDIVGARRAWQRALALNPLFEPARRSLGVP
jgi:tetratricopeptide (TPR) repeat protein